MINKAKAHLNAHTAFLLIATTFGLLFVFTTPLLWGQDEITHFGRAYEISQGQMLPVPFQTGSATNYGGNVPTSAYKLISFVANDLRIGEKAAQKDNNIGLVRQPAQYKLLGSKSINDNKKSFLLFPNTAPYSPFAYFPSIIGLFVSDKLNFDLTNSIHLARLLPLIFYVTTVYYLLRSLRRYRARWVILSVALLPTAIYQASTITADTMTIITMMVVSALYLKTFLGEKLNSYET